MSLGLDLQGGAHLLAEVDIDAGIKQRAASFEDTVRSALRGAEFVDRHQKDWVQQFDSARSTLRILLEQLSWSKKQTKVPRSQ